MSLRIRPFTLILLACLTAPAAAADVGVVAPLSGSFAPLGEQMRRGTEIAAAQLQPGAISFEDDECTAEGGARAANALAAANVKIVIGFLCTESIEAALPILSAAGIPTITPGVRTDSLTDGRERSGWLVFRTAPRADAEREAAERLLLPRWRNAHFALVDDGTIYGRELVEHFRLAAETSGLKPVFVDTFRPQMENQVGLAGRLRRAGASHVLVGGERDDVAIIARDGASLDAGLTIVAGETLRVAAGDVPLAEGTLMIGLPDPQDIASAKALAAFAKQETLPEGYALPAYAAVEVAHAAVRMAERQGSSLHATIASGSFSTSLGPIEFDSKGDLRDNPYRLFRFDGEAFIEEE